jgi:glycosyltransferase involved in cell wall biosynthesis
VKFSVLVPTRNRLEYLKQVITTVRAQDYDDWEVIVSDNDSAENISGYVASLGDARVKYYRTEQFVPVTENWNIALEKSTGEYVLMLGDDDGLLRDYFGAAARLIEKFDSPDVVYTGAYFYSYPGGMPDAPDGYVRPYGYASFLQNAVEPYILDRARAVEIGKEVLKFRVVYGFNTQFYLFRRGFMDSLRAAGPFYQSAFPDYYATNVAFLKAEKILVCPSPMVVIGVCPKSYGAYFNSNREAQGVKFLTGARAEAVDQKLRAKELPGSNINTSWLHAAETIKVNYGSEFGLEVDYARYRGLQALLVLKEHDAGLRPRDDVTELMRRLGPTEWVLFNCIRLLPARLRARVINRLTTELKQFIHFDHGWKKEGVKDMSVVFEHASPVRYEYQ